jgi:hypothetical protein
MTHYWAWREDIGKEGWMMFGPGGTVEKIEGGEQA